MAASVENIQRWRSVRIFPSKTLALQPCAVSSSVHVFKKIKFLCAKLQALLVFRDRADQDKSSFVFINRIKINIAIESQSYVHVALQEFPFSTREI